MEDRIKLFTISRGDGDLRRWPVTRGGVRYNDVRGDVSPYFAQVKILDATVNRGSYNENSRLVSLSGFTPEEVGEVAAQYYRIGNIAVPDIYALKDMNDKRTELVSVFFKELYGNPLDLVNSYRDFYVKIVTEVFGNGNGKGQNLHYSKRRRLRRMVQNALCRHGLVFRRRTR